MPISSKDKKDLEQIYSDYKAKYEGRKEDYFALLFLTKRFKCSVEEIAHQISFGANDYGIDAYYIDRAARNLYLYQFKWSENHDSFKASFERLTNDGIELVFSSGISRDPGKSELLHYLAADLFECRSLIERVYIQFVFKGDIEAADKSIGLQYRREDLENKKHHMESYFDNRLVDLRVEFVSDRRIPPPPPPKSTHTISFTERISLPVSDGHALHVGFLKLADLHWIYKEIGPKFLSRNIRAALSSDNPPNRKIRNALAQIAIKQQATPESFTFNHNGITLAAEHVDFENGHAILKAPRLLNGAQTVTSFSIFMEENEDNPALKANKAQLDAIRVLAKIVVADTCDDDFITTVTICNNQQNPVEPWNLRANDKIQCDLQDKFSEHKIYYSRQEKAFENLSDGDLEDLGIEDSHDIRIRPLAQTFLALQGRIDRISQLRDVFEVQKSYDETFRDSYLDCDTRYIVLIYKVHLVLNTPMRAIEQKIANSFVPVIRKARNLIWALLVQSLLNDKHLDNLLDLYGTSLSKQVDFREYLANLASNRVLTIIREAFKDDVYAQKIMNEKYDFIRTQEIYRRCMNIAADKYGWSKKALS